MRTRQRFLSARSKNGQLARTIGLFVLFTLMPAAVIAQESSPVKSENGRSFSLRVESGDVIGISLKAKETALPEIAGALTRHLKIPVNLSSLMHKHKVSADFSDLSFEPALQLLAPQVFIDYRIEKGVQSPVAVYLYGHNEAQPPLNAEVRSASEAMLIEGDTEDGVEPADKNKTVESPLRISLENNRLTIKAKKQPLTFVVLRLGSDLSVPVELRDEPMELVNTNIVNVPWEEAIQRVSPQLTFFVRADLQRLERRLMRLVLMPPTQETASTAQEDK